MLTMNKYLLHLLAVAAVLSAMLSCGHQQQNARKQTEVDSLINLVWDTEDYERLITLCDSLEQTGDISIIRASTERGIAKDRLNKWKEAEDEYKKALAETPKNEADSLLLYQCAYYLADYYCMSDNNEGVLQLALPMIEEMKVWAEKKPSDQIFESLQRLTGFVVLTQIKLGMIQEAEKMCELSVKYMDMRKSTSNKLWDIYVNAIQINNIIIALTNAKEYTTAEKFLPRLDSLTSEITAIQDSTAASYVDQVQSGDYFLHASIDNAMNRPKEAAHYLALYQNT